MAKQIRWFKGTDGEIGMTSSLLEEMHNQVEGACWFNSNELDKIHSICNTLDGVQAVLEAEDMGEDRQEIATERKNIDPCSPTDVNLAIKVLTAVNSLGQLVNTDTRKDINTALKVLRSAVR